MLDRALADRARKPARFPQPHLADPRKPEGLTLTLDRPRAVAGAKRQGRPLTALEPRRPELALHAGLLRLVALRPESPQTSPAPSGRTWRRWGVPESGGK